MNEGAIMEPVHPGEILLEEYLEPLGVTQHRLAVAIGVPPRRINEIVHGKRGISADTALRLARYLGTTERIWLNGRRVTTWRWRRTVSPTFSPGSPRCAAPDHPLIRRRPRRARPT